MAELAVRCLPTARNNSFHFGSDLGAQMVATYHSIISMVKFHDSSDGVALVFF
jgi:transposase